MSYGENTPVPMSLCGPGSSVGIATGYGLDGPGPNPNGDEIFRTCPDRPWGPPSLLYNGYRVFPGGKVRPGRVLTTLPLLMPWSRKSRAIPLLPLWTVQPVQSLSACTTVHFTFTYTSTPSMDRTACTESQCLYNGTLYLYLYLYSPYGAYSLFTASVPVQRYTLALPYCLNKVLKHFVRSVVHFNSDILQEC